MIFVECYPDVALVRLLTGVSKREMTHEFKGKGEICNRLRKTGDCTGLVDEDPSSGQPAFLREARVEEDLPEQGIRVLHHEATGNRLIVLCPRLEEWILDVAKGVGVRVSDYGLPNDPRQLHGQINLSLGRFGDLVEALRTSSDRLGTLKERLQPQV